MDLFPNFIVHVSFHLLRHKSEGQTLTPDKAGTRVTVLTEHFEARVEHACPGIIPDPLDQN